ncbi:PREDICTED: protein GAST1-like [Ipomoea nil]|uniref:protein GAST1-like n=1 Tax=Ipomoea nil TaxID=35883 RepID=UPI000901CD4B|nr:PREDICTED: protein GAST1-like [Ipomoea nil]
MQSRSVCALLFLCILLLICFLQNLASAQIQNDFQSTTTVQQHKKHRHSGFSQAECGDACTYRCSKTAYKKPCMFFCQKCCFKCRCVPPGTYGHKQVCPCYNNWKTKRGGPKCP